MTSRKLCPFRFRGLHGCRSHCDLEIISLDDRRTVIIATERSDNPGTSVTNIAEVLATLVCAMLEVEPDRLVWIEHYTPDSCPVCGGSGRRADSLQCRGCHGQGKRRERDTYDLVTFAKKAASCGWVFSDPNWRPMSEEDWKTFGLELRR